MTTKQTLSLHFSSISALGLRRTLTYIDDKCYRLSSADSGQLQPLDSNVSQHWVLVAARQHYSEVVRSYPVEQRSEVKKLLALEYQGKRFHYQIAKREKGKTLVNVWVFSSHLPQALFTLPESLLLSYALAEGQVGCFTQATSTGKARNLYVLRSAGVLYSQQGSAMVRSADAFLLSIGHTSEQSVLNVDGRDVSAKLMAGVRAMSLSSWSRFFSLPRADKTQQKQFLKQALLPLAAIGGLYLLATTAWLFGREWYLQKQLDTQQSELRTVFGVQDQIANRQQLYQDMQNLLTKQENISGLWFVMADLFKQASFSRLAYERGRFVLAGQAAKATAVLEKISLHPRIQEAKFDSPTRTNRSMERFVISFTLKPTGTLNAPEVEDGPQ